MKKQAVVAFFIIASCQSGSTIANNTTSFEIGGEIKPKCEVIRHGQHFDVRFHIDGKTMSTNVNIR